MQTDMAATHNWTVRPALGSDVHFIYSSWLKSYRVFGLACRGCRDNVFYPEYTKTLDHILSQPGTRVSVACLPNNPDVIIGFLVHAPKTAHYSYIKESFRKLGVAKSLLESAFPDPDETIHVTHQSKDFKPIMMGKYKNKFIYNPFLLFNHSIHEGEIQWQDQKTKDL